MKLEWMNDTTISNVSQVDVSKDIEIFLSWCFIDNIY